MNNTVTETEADRLNRSIAELMGWGSYPYMIVNTEVHLWPHSQEQADSHTGGWNKPPDYCNDLNALRDGPEAKLRAAGLYCNHFEASDGAERWDWMKDGRSVAAHLGKRGEPVRALAAEAAVKAMRDA